MPTPDTTEFIADARAWLAQQAPPRRSTAWGDGDDSVAVFENWTETEEREETDRIRRYEQTKFDAGWGALTWPAAYGGRDLPLAHALAFQREEAAFDVPRRTEMFSVTQQLVAPTIAQWGTDEQKATYVRAMLRTDLIACQLFSETEAGSDLAAVRTRAVERDGSWVLDGHKVWTSGARIADLGIAVCRTDPTAAKHAGLTVFLVPLDTPRCGGAADPADDRRQQLQRGLSRRRRAGRCPAARPRRRGLEGRTDGARRRAPRLRQPRARQRRPRRRARPATADRCRRSTATPSPTWSPAAMSSGSPECASPLPSWRARHPDPRHPSASSWPPTPWRVRPRSSACCSAPSSRSTPAAWGTWAWTEHVLGAPGYRIAGGTDEIQHNILAERVLGLPREPRP